VQQLEQLAVDGLVGALLAKVREIIPSYAGHATNGEPAVQHLNAESRKPRAAAPPSGAAVDIAADRAPLGRGACRLRVSRVSGQATGDVTSFATSASLARCVGCATRARRLFR